MKIKSKLIAFVLLLAMTLTTFTGVYAAESKINLVIDNKTIGSDVAPILVDGTTLIPLRVATETLGADVSWNKAKQQATVKTAAYTVVFTIGSKEYLVNNSAKTLTVAPQIIEGRTLVPLRALSESIGATVNYDASTKTASVNYFSTMTGTLKLTGSTTVQPITQAAADALIKMNPKLSISVAGGGSGAGVKDTIAGTNNIGASSRELTADELAKINATAIANDGIAIIVNPKNPVKNLSKEDAAKIFLGEIKNWKEVGGNDAPILVQTRETGSGTRATLEEMILSKKSVVATATPFPTSALIKQAVAKEANAIGFDSIGFVDATVKAVSINNIAPTTETVLSGAYPMARSLFLLTNGQPSGMSAMFIDYIKTTDSQNNFVIKEGYISIR